MVSQILLLLLGLIQCGTVYGDSKKKAEFRAVEPEYNARLQKACGNTEFVDVAEGPTTLAPRHDDEHVVEQRVFGGNISLRGKHPWAVGTRVFSVPFCSGAIISKRHILTSRYCLKYEQYAECLERFKSISGYTRNC